MDEAGKKSAIDGRESVHVVVWTQRLTTSLYFTDHQPIIDNETMAQLYSQFEIDCEPKNGFVCASLHL